MSKLLDRILGESNMIIALHQVKLKKGSGGVDGIEMNTSKTIGRESRVK